MFLCCFSGKRENFKIRTKRVVLTTLRRAGDDYFAPGEGNYWHAVFGNFFFLWTYFQGCVRWCQMVSDGVRCVFIRWFCFVLLSVSFYSSVGSSWGVLVSAVELVFVCFHPNC